MESVTLCWCTCGVCYLAETARCLWGCVDGACDIMLVYMQCVFPCSDCKGVCDAVRMGPVTTASCFCCSLSESYFTVKGAALILPHSDLNRKTSRKNHGGEPSLLFLHLFAGHRMAFMWSKQTVAGGSGGGGGGGRR